MAAPMEKTRYTGVFRRGSRYVATWRAGGKQHKRSARTLEGARRLRASMQGDVARDEFDPQSALTFREYAEEWLPRYHGGRRGFRQNTRDDYRRHLERFAYPWFGAQVPYPEAPTRPLRLSEIRPRDVNRFVAWLANGEAQAEHERRQAEQAVREAERRRRTDGGDEAREELAAVRRRMRRLRDREREAREAGGAPAKPLGDRTIRNILCPVRSCLRTAVEEELIRSNPTTRVALPNREPVDEEENDDESREDGEREVRVLSREQLAMLLRVLPERWRLFFRFLVCTGLRISEATGLQWRHLELDGSSPHVKVRRAIVRGRIGRPKSKYGRREVPLPFELVCDLRRHRQETEWPRERDPVFASMRGTPLEGGNVRRRVLAPAAEEAGVEWAGFHTFRHTCASLLSESGRNAKQVQRWLGHHKASFTLDTYIHLLSAELDAPLDVATELQSGNRVASRVSSAGMDGDGLTAPDSAFQSESAAQTQTGRDPR
jgi:integrase